MSTNHNSRMVEVLRVAAVLHRVVVRMSAMRVNAKPASGPYGLGRAS